jgi:hypothetical protein
VLVKPLEPVSEQLVAPVAFHVSVVALPLRTRVGDALSETVGTELEGHSEFEGVSAEQTQEAL